MRKPKRILAAIMSAAVIASAVPSSTEVLTVEAHSGRTDSSGGHRDNRNASGLGYYHYHCGGYPPHLHPGGVCPYSGGGSVEFNSGSGSGSSATHHTTKLKINKKMISLAVGESATLKLNISSSKASWNSSNKKSATVSANGVVKAKKPGKSTISAKYNGKTVKCKVYVSKKLRDPVSVATSNIKIRTVDWWYMSDDICFYIKNNTSDTIIIQNTLKALDDDYRFLGMMKMPFNDYVVIPAGTGKRVKFLDFNFDDIIFYTQRFIFKIEIGGSTVRCRAEYTYDNNEPYGFTFCKD